MPRYGIRYFTVGTGGDSHQGFGTPIAGSEARDGNTYGILKLTLHPTSYDWTFLPVAGSTFTNSGTRNVHDAPPGPNNAPVAVADAYSTPQDTAKVVAAPGVLGNDTDADSDPLTAVARHERRPRHAEPRAERRLHLHADGRLQRARQLHLPRQRRDRQLERRDGLADGHAVASTYYVDKTNGELLGRRGRLAGAAVLHDR